MQSKRFVICPICRNRAFERLMKKETTYFQCDNCKTLFSGPLNNADMVGGGNEESRNMQENFIRIDRFGDLLNWKKSKNILDYGCGHGMLVHDLRVQGFSVWGYDPYNPEFDLMPSMQFDLVSMIEVIEHLSSPYEELEEIHRTLKEGGYLYVETSFVDVAAEENIPLEEFFYIEPSVGHSTIFSHHGLDLLMALVGFMPCRHINRNARVFQKITKE